RDHLRHFVRRGLHVRPPADLAPERQGFHPSFVLRALRLRKHGTEGLYEGGVFKRSLGRVKLKGGATPRAASSVHSFPTPRTFISRERHCRNMWIGDRDATATRIGIEVAAVAILAIIAVVIFNPSLGPSVTALV